MPLKHEERHNDNSCRLRSARSVPVVCPSQYFMCMPCVPFQLPRLTQNTAGPQGSASQVHLLTYTPPKPKQGFFNLNTTDTLANCHWTHWMAVPGLYLLMLVAAKMTGNISPDATKCLLEANTNMTDVVPPHGFKCHQHHPCRDNFQIGTSSPHLSLGPLLIHPAAWWRSPLAHLMGSQSRCVQRTAPDL